MLGLSGSITNLLKVNTSSVPDRGLFAQIAHFDERFVQTLTVMLWSCGSLPATVKRCQRRRRPDCLGIRIISSFIDARAVRRFIAGSLQAVKVTGVQSSAPYRQVVSPCPAAL